MSKELLIKEFGIPTELLEDKLWADFPLNFEKIYLNLQQHKELSISINNLESKEPKLLWLALLSGNFAAYERILSRDPIKADVILNNTLAAAIRHDLFDVMQYLIGKYNLAEMKWVLKGEYNALQYAALYGKTEVVKFLIRKGFNPLHVNIHEKNAQICAFNGLHDRKHSNAECKQFIEKYGYAYYLLFNLNNARHYLASENEVFKDIVKHRTAIFAWLKQEYVTTKRAYLAANDPVAIQAAFDNFQRVVDQLKSIVSCDRNGYFTNFARAFHVKVGLFSVTVFDKPPEGKELPQVVKDIRQLIADGNKTIRDKKTPADEKSLSGSDSAPSSGRSSPASQTSSESRSSTSDSGRSSPMSQTFSDSKSSTSDSGRESPVSQISSGSQVFSVFFTKPGSKIQNFMTPKSEIMVDGGVVSPETNDAVNTAGVIANHTDQRTFIISHRL